MRYRVKTMQMLTIVKNVMLSICIRWLNVRLVVTLSHTKATVVIAASWEVEKH